MSDPWNMNKTSLNSWTSYLFPLFIQVTQDGYLNRKAGDGSFEELDEVLQSPIMLQTAAGDAFACDRFSLDHFDTFGAGEAAEDTATLYAAEFQPADPSTTSSSYQPVYPDNFYDRRHTNSSTYSLESSSASFIDVSSRPSLPYLPR